MASIAKRTYKDDWNYELRWRENGKSRRLALQTQNLRVAKTALKQLNLQILNKKFTIDEPPDLMLSEFSNLYLNHRKTRVAPATVEDDKYALRSLLKCLGDVRLGMLTFSTIDDQFINTRLKQVKPGSVNVEIRHLKSVFTYGVEHEQSKIIRFQKLNK